MRTIFVLRIPGIVHGVARLRHIRGARFTQWGEVEVQVRHGEVQLPAGFSLIWVKHRHGRHQAMPQIGPARRLGRAARAPSPPATRTIHTTSVVRDAALRIWRWPPTGLMPGGGMALSRQGIFSPTWRCRLPACFSDLPAAESRVAVRRITRPERKSPTGSRPTGYLRPSKAPASPAMPDHI